MTLYEKLYFLKKRPRTVESGLFIAIFSLLSIVVVSASYYQISNSVTSEIRAQVSDADPMDDRLSRTLSALHGGHGMAPCSKAFLRWLRDIAFLPDGIHEIVFTDGSKHCSVTGGELLSQPDLGQPDLFLKETGYQFWLDRDLADFNHAGLKGTLLQSGHFILVLPPLSIKEVEAPWNKRAFMTLGPNGNWLHRAGEPGLIDRYAQAKPGDYGFNFEHLAFWGLSCSDERLVCLVLEAPLKDVLMSQQFIISLIMIALIALSFALTGIATGFIARRWAFPARFERTMSNDTLVCYYQPIMSLHSGEIAGVEVLIRWRDIDGTIKYPDSFLPIVEARNMSKQLTEIVVQNAVRDLADMPFSVANPRVNINVFPQDFDAFWLAEILEPFFKSATSFQPVVEIVETSDLQIDVTRDAIAFLRSNGIETYIDDFGVGYSSIHYLSGLNADGVKLDRSFALAPDGSMTSTMMYSAIDMIAKTGQKLVIEGVETKARLMRLRATNQVDLVQGYYISRPLPIDELVKFLDDFEPEVSSSDSSVPNLQNKIRSVFS